MKDGKALSWFENGYCWTNDAFVKDMTYIYGNWIIDNAAHCSTAKH